MLQLKLSCASGLLASAIRSSDPPARSLFPTLCSMLLSRMRHPSACAALRLPYSTRSTLYVQLSNVSMACFSAAPTTYTLAPDFRSRMPSAHASAETKIVLPFFLGIKMNASLTRRSLVPLI